MQNPDSPFASGIFSLASISTAEKHILTAVEELEEQQQQFEKYKREYHALHDVIVRLPEKTSHQIMVPLHGVAFIPGRLVHTNEILVLLGDNYFAERSAAQAAAIIDRRNSYLSEKLETVQRQLASFQERLKLAVELKEQTQELDGDGIVDIREEYVSSEESVNDDAGQEGDDSGEASDEGEGHTDQVPDVSGMPVAVGAGSHGFDPDLERRLKYLMRLQQMEEEEEEEDDEDEDVDTGGAEHKRVRWKDQVEENDDDDDLSVISEDDEEDDNAEEQDQVFTSPGDIYSKVMGHQESSRKVHESIPQKRVQDLFQQPTDPSTVPSPRTAPRAGGTSGLSPAGNLLAGFGTPSAPASVGKPDAPRGDQSGRRPRPARPEQPVAFSGAVVERNMERTSEEPPTSNATTASTGKVSRFKARRPQL